MTIKPLLYITDESSFFRQLQVVGWGSKSYSFVWEPKFAWSRLGIRSVGAYVRRYESLEAFDAEQSNLVGRQRKWPVFFGVEVELDSEAGVAEARERALIATNERLAERLRFLEVALQAQGEAKPDAVPSLDPAPVELHPIDPYNPKPAVADPVFPAVPSAPVAPTALDVPPPPADEQPPRRRKG